MDLRTPRLTAPLSLALIITMLCGIVFAAPQVADAQSTCLGRAVTVNIGAGQQPTNGHDVIMGTSGANNINGKGGNDRICGGGGQDIINGGSGHDIIDGGGGADKIYGGSTGNDTIYGGSGGDQIWGRNGNDTIYGQGGADKIYGEDGHDAIWGGNGADILWGGSGNDQLNGEGSNDKLYGEAGADTLIGGYGTDFANGGGYYDICDAETETNCENPLAPQWVSGAELSIDSMSLDGFTISWGAFAGGRYTPETLEVTVYDAGGNPDHPWTIHISDGHLQFPVTSYNSQPLNPTEAYSVEVVAVNSEGRSNPIGIRGIGILTIEVEADSGSNVGSAGYASGDGSSDSPFYRSTHFSPEPCFDLETTLGLKQAIRFRRDNHVQFDVISQVCAAGGVISDNITAAFCTDTKGNTSSTPSKIITPAGIHPNSSFVYNEYACDISNDSTNSFTIGVEKYGTGVGYTVEERVFIEANLIITHHVEPWGAGLCMKTLAAPASNGGPAETTCPPVPAPTG